MAVGMAGKPDDNANKQSDTMKGVQSSMVAWNLD